VSAERGKSKRRCACGRCDAWVGVEEEVVPGGRASGAKRLTRKKGGSVRGVKPFYLSRRKVPVKKIDSVKKRRDWR